MIGSCTNYFIWLLAYNVLMTNNDTWGNIFIQRIGLQILIIYIVPYFDRAYRMKILMTDNGTKILSSDIELTIVKKLIISKLNMFIRFVELMAMITCWTCHRLPCGRNFFNCFCSDFNTLVIIFLKLSVSLPINKKMIFSTSFGM